MNKTLILLLFLSSILNAQKIATFTTDKNNQKTYLLSKSWIELTVDELKELDKEFSNNQNGNLEDGLKFIRSNYKNFDADINEFEFLKKLQIITNEKRDLESKIENKFLFLNENCCSKKSQNIAIILQVLGFQANKRPSVLKEEHNLKSIEEAEKQSKIYKEKRDEALELLKYDKKIFQENLFELYKLLGYEENSKKLTSFQLSGIQKVLFSSEIIAEILKNKSLNHLTNEKKKEFKTELSEIEKIEDFKGIINPLTQYLIKQL